MFPWDNLLIIAVLGIVAILVGRYVILTWYAEKWKFFRKFNEPEEGDKDYGDKEE